MAKQRADQLLVDRGLAESRTRAQALILAGLAFVGDRKIDKAGQQIAEGAEISVKGRDHPWVSRGGIKLDHALSHLEQQPVAACRAVGNLGLQFVQLRGGGRGRMDAVEPQPKHLGLTRLGQRLQSNQHWRHTDVL